MVRTAGAARPTDPSSPLRYVRGIGPARAALLAEKGYGKAEDLLLHFPFRYEDRSRFAAVSALGRVTGRVAIMGRVLSSSLFTTRRRGLKIVRALVDDGSGAIECLWFNQPFIRDQLETGAEVVIYGAPVPAQGRSGALQMQSPEWEIVTHGRGDEIHMGRIVPIHRRLPGLSPKALRRTIHDFLDSLPVTFPTRSHLPCANVSI